MKNILFKVKHFFFPDFCSLCGCNLIKPKEIKTILCEDCNSSVFTVSGDLCKICGKPLVSEKEECLSCRNGDKKSYKRQFLLFPYSGIYRKLLASYKFEKKSGLAVFFAEKILELIENEEELKNAVLIPVPARPGKIKNTGWDQVEYLVKKIKQQGKKQVSCCLKRKESKVQKQLDRKERLSNLKGRIYARGVLPETALIIDDVTTTGATIEACSSVLKENGVKNIYTLCLFYD